MADDLKPLKREEKHSIFYYLSRIISNRYFILSLLFCIVGAVILFRTAALQFSGYQKTISASSEGVSRQYTVSAPRGDIVDRNGVVLAGSEQVNTVMITNAGLDDDKLNSLCLELSYLFDTYNCISIADLDDYFTVAPFEFHKEEDDIRLWQTNRNLFNLNDYTEGIIVTFSDNYVKTDPQVFFLYLRHLFSIDEGYTEDEANRIIRIRYQIFQDNWSFLNGSPVKIATDVPDELVTIFNEQNYHYQGIITTPEYRRTYSPLAQLSCHVVGYVGNISQESLATLQPFGYTNDDLVGQSGVESQMERYLHGSNGISTYSTWTEDGADGIYFPAAFGTEPVPGATVQLTIDSDLQRVGVEALKQYIADAAEYERVEQTGYKTASAGAFVMMDVRSGGVLAMGSYPNFDPNDFMLAMYGDVQAEEQLEYYLGLNEYEDITAEDMPLWNRAIMSQYAPGSTFKMCTALAGLEANVITPDVNWIKCESPVDIGGWTFRCLEFPDSGHGTIDLYSAIAQSDNIYFMQLGVQTGIDRIDEMGEMLGLGEYTGIDLPGETCGTRASRETKRLLHDSEYDRTWFPADTAQSSIGQFDNCFTIMQLCRYTAAIATGELVTPYVIDSVTANDGSILYEGRRPAEPLDISENNLEAIRFAMRCVVTGTSSWTGTAQDQFVGFPIDVACKTGTAETGYEEIRMEYSNGLFVCYAPADDPEVAIALVVERGEWGSSTVIIAKKLLAAYFGIPLSRADSISENYPIAGNVFLESIEPTAAEETPTP